MCEIHDRDGDYFKIKTKNKFFINTDIEVISPSERFTTQALEIKNSAGEMLECANTNDELWVKFAQPINDYKYAIVRTVGIKIYEN